MKLRTAFFSLAMLVLAASSCARKVDAAAFGFSPDAAPSDNVQALQTALDGGHKTVVIRTPGVYDLDATVYLDDFTTLECAEGVVLRKAAPYSHILLNRGALTREYNTDITLRGVTLSVNGFDQSPTEESPLFGLRAHLAFLYAHNVGVYDFRLEDMCKMQYAVQFDVCDHFVLDGFVIRGDKDAVHISACDSFVVRNGVVRSFDDALALNASDWASSNCVDGDITNGLIENITDEYLEPTSGVLCRLLLGAWVDWHPGISVKRSDMVVHDGRMYRVIAPVSNDEYISEIPPVIDTYEGSQPDNGFSWKLMRKDTVYYRTAINHIVFRNIKGLSTRCAFSEQVFGSDCEWARTLHPEVALEDYPTMEDVLVEDCSFPVPLMLFGKSSLANTSFTFRNVRDFRYNLDLWGTGNPSLRNEIAFYDCDFSANADSTDFKIGEFGHVTVVGATGKDTLVVEGPGRIEADIPVRLY